MTDDRSIVNVEVMRELAGENNPCQTCDDENMTGCIIDYLSNHQRKGYANDIDKSYCYSDTQKDNNCNDKSQASWIIQINNLIEEDNYSIASCLFTYHCCAAFNYEKSALDITHEQKIEILGEPTMTAEEVIAALQ